ESTAGNFQRIVRTPFPIIRLADLYLMQAEALNEYGGPTPSQEVYDAINLVRRRAGIPDVEASWGNPAWARTLNKHRTQEGMREIILQERSIELAFEGQHFWTMHRHKKAHTEFTKDVMGWNYQGPD
ncbi:RagB/SusD family nutrient uptake outer membrane protein, partial [Candidatus Symbiothrix dinenymphae]|uniref:RagB/SusD family nutrient uptake outer membrane protein n=1 Tax=Candidatus Symbiothrix dinenymphae TaxID=467085 RepID=UPI000A9591D4